MNTFDQLISTFSSSGKEFELLCKWILETDPVYANKLVDVWMWADWPDRWADQDLGIDLIAKDTEGKIWAIQAKNYNPDYYVTKEDIDSFISESDNDQIDCRLLIATTENIGPNAKKVIDRSASVRSFSCLMLDELKSLPIVWPNSIDDVSGGGITEKYTPKPHQQKAIRDVVEGFKTHDRGQMIMACGTGKTLAGLWIAEALEAQTTLVLLPSLLLLSSTLKDWLTHSKEPFSFLPVCSDGTVTKKADDSINLKTSDLSFPSTTDEAEIAEFLKRDGKKVIFSTYQSCRQIAAAFRIADLRPLDLVIADEAHRCAGKAGVDYTTALDNREIPAIKRLFMTATPKIYQTHIKKAAAESGVEVLSMDDEDLFGPVIHKLSFGEAIEQKLLSDYQVVVVGVDDSLCAEMISERQLVKTENDIETDAQSFASHIGLAKAIKSYDLRRVITFHSKVKSANKFQQDFSEVVDWMPEASRPDGRFITNYVSGEMSTSLRNQNLRRLGELEDGERAILSNARCLSEGVDVPALDGVAFIDPRNSEIDIVQAVGRAIRLSSNKTVGTIVIPVFIAEHEDPDEVFNSSVFKKVWAVVNALRSHDEGLGTELDVLRQELGKRGSVGKSDKIYFDLPTTISVKFEKALNVKLIESSTASWEFWFGLLQAYYEIYGDIFVPIEFNDQNKYNLGKWVSRQRVRYSENKILAIETKKLESIGFIWDAHEYRWERNYKALKNYHINNGNCDVPLEFETSDGLKLGVWVRLQRTNLRSGKLLQEKKHRLESLDFVFNPEENAWQEAHREFAFYREIYGNVFVPKGFITKSGINLYSWILTQRAKFKRRELSSEKVSKLTKVGFIWDTSEYRWENYFRLFLEYKKEHGDFNVPLNFETSDGSKLGIWLSNQKKNFRKKKLSKERQRKIENSGCILTVNAYDKKWQQALAYLEDYKLQFGNVNVPKSYVNPKGFKLGYFLRRMKSEQRRNKLEPGRYEILSYLGVVWDVFDASWKQGIDKLISYRTEHGNCLVPQDYLTEDNFKLGQWVANRRKDYRLGKLDSIRIEELESLGFVWNKVAPERENATKRLLKELREYVSEFGNCAVPQKYISDSGFALGSSVSNLRQKYIKRKLDSNLVAELEKLGFIWSAEESMWSSAFLKLEQFHDEHKNVNIPYNYKMSCGFALGLWASKQRKLYRKGMLSEKRRERLLGLGFAL